MTADIIVLLLDVKRICLDRPKPRLTRGFFVHLIHHVNLLAVQATGTAALTIITTIEHNSLNVKLALAEYFYMM